jgi:hypothetical protein
MIDAIRLAIPIIFLTSILVGCNVTVNEKTATDKTSYELIRTAFYTVEKPSDSTAATLILFGGYPENAEDIQREFAISEIAQSNKIAVVYMNFNRTLWFENNQLDSLSNVFVTLLDSLDLPTKKLCIGGFSSGGAVALHLSNYLQQIPKDNYKPSSVFIVDSPIDLSQLYYTSEKNLERAFSEVSVQESKWIIHQLGNRLGNPHEDISPYEQHSIFTWQTKHVENLAYLKNTALRLYTEPDTAWWKENRMVTYEETNAFLIHQLHQTLQNTGFKHVSYIATENKGYRANGDRHPHSWSIVNKEDLIEWILNE